MALCLNRKKKPAAIDNRAGFNMISPFNGNWHRAAVETIGRSASDSLAGECPLKLYNEQKLGTADIKMNRQQAQSFMDSL
jgi:hypothetical protein